MGLMEIQGLLVRPDGFLGKGGQDDRLQDIIVQSLGAHLVVHRLGAAYHQGEAVNPVGAPVPVFHPHLGFTVQGEIRNRFVLVRLDNLPCQLMRQPDGERHENVGLAAGEAKHRGLLPDGDLVDLLVSQIFFIKI